MSYVQGNSSLNKLNLKPLMRCISLALLHIYMSYLIIIDRVLSLSFHKHTEVGFVLQRVLYHNSQ